MDNNRKKPGKLDIITIALAALALIGTAVCFLNRDMLILFQGIRMYRIYLAASLILLGGSGVLAVCTVCLHAAEKKRLMAAQAELLAQQEESLRETRKQTAKLSVEGELNAAVIREMLVAQSKGRWAFAYQLIYDCVEQMEQMDSYQERLATLLENNGADSLQDTVEVVDQVEQYLCRNVRNVLNFMDVADDDAADQVRVKLLSCKEDNQNLLTQTRDFIYALAEFLNDQGGKADMRLLNTYRTTILQSLKEGAL